MEIMIMYTWRSEMNKEAISSVFSFEPSLEELRQDSYWDMSIKSDLLDSITDSVTYQEPQSTMPKKRSVQEIMRDAKHLKTQSRYDKAWDSFMAYHNHPDIKEVDEEKFIQYFDMLINEKKFVFNPMVSFFYVEFRKPVTLWSKIKWFPSTHGTHQSARTWLCSETIRHFYESQRWRFFTICNKF